MTMNSTISELVQDNSNVTTETNPIDTVQSNELIFGQKHNDIDCALCPTARRACDRAWVTAKNLEEWSSMSTTTLWRWLGRLEKARRIASFSDMKKTPILDSAGVPHETTLYNLNVLNQLAMACIDDEIILGNFKGNDSLPLANRGNAFVSLRGVLEILSKTELSSDIVDNFQDEVFGANDVKFLTSLTPKFLATSVYDRKRRMESTRIGRDSSLCFRNKLPKAANPRSVSDLIQTQKPTKTLGEQTCADEKSKIVTNSSLMWMPTSEIMSKFH